MGWYSEGGPVMLLILLVGIAGLAVLVERLYVIVFRAQNNGRAFIERVIQLVRGGKVDEAIKACAASTAALPDMGLLILRSRSRDESDLQNVADAAALHVLPKLTRRLDYLPTLATVAILLGVLGTVNGIHDAFLNAPAAADHNVQLWVALAYALTPTTFGLARRDRADAWRAAICESGGIHHRRSPRVLGAAHQRADRPAGRAARPPLTLPVVSRHRRLHSCFDARSRFSLSRSLARSRRAGTAAPGAASAT